MFSHLSKKQTRVCQICAVEFTYNKFLSPLCHFLASEGFDVHLAFNPGLTCNGKSIDSFIFHPIPISRSTSLSSLAISTWRLYLLFRQYKFDIIHVHTPVASIAARLAALIAGTPIVIYTAHGFYFNDQMSLPLRVFHISIEYFLSKLTSVLLTQSSEDAAFAKRFHFLPASRIVAIGNGVCSARFAPPSPSQRLDSRNFYRISPDAIVIGIVARLVKEKGYIELLEAFHSLVCRFSDFNPMLLICGARLESDHADAVDLDIQHYQSLLPGRILNIGSTDNVESVYRAIDIFCLPSYREGMPRTIIEAMMTALPVVATDIRGCREEIIHGISGYLVKPKDSTSLCDALSRLLINKEMRDSFGSAGLKRALSVYKEQDVLDKQLEIYQRLISNV